MSPHPITRLGDSHTPEKHHLLSVENLHIHYGKICALKNVTFEIGCGHCVGLLGQNGAGKSTLIKTIAGLNQKLTGSATWSGRPLSESKAEIAYLPQVGNIDPLFPLTVKGLVELGRYPHLGPRGRWRKEDSEVVQTALSSLKLDDLAGRRLFQLSGGQLQRAQIARALAQEAHVLLLDEPFAGLDEPSQDFLSDLFRELADNGRLLLVCHHDLKAVPRLFDTVLMLNREMVAFGPTQDVFTRENLAKTFPGQEVVVHV
ncbi:metal ABC transporter ATP-binding protein [Kiritimatiellaeota bacterium B1221]|nr:metal ABC transporter ATP-binding protein [Kiritimatiellaeota bacterium B1221]